MRTRHNRSPQLWTLLRRSPGQLLTKVSHRVRNCVQVLKRVGVNKRHASFQYLQTVYRHTTMAIVTKEWRSQSQWARGAIQGDTLSPLLFYIFFQVVIQSAERKRELYQVEFSENIKQEIHRKASFAFVLSPHIKKKNNNKVFFFW